MVRTLVTLFLGRHFRRFFIAMPYAALLFEDAFDASMRDTASQIAAGSQFVPYNDFLHVPLLGSLHVYPDADVYAALRRASVAHAPVTGRFCKWEIHRSLLRVTVELSGDIAKQLAGALPRGKPWKCLYVVIGSVEAIPETQRSSFLAAVEAAFPIDPNVVFTTSKLDFHNMQPQSKPSAGDAPKMSNKARKKPSAQRRPQPSPHKKWTRTKQPHDKLLTKAKNALIQTGNMISKMRKHAPSGAVQRAAAVQKARARNV